MTHIIVTIVPIYIGCVFAKLSYSGEIFSTLKSFGIVYILLFSLQLVYIVIGFTVNINMKNVAIKDNIEYLLSVNVPIIA